MHPVRPTPGRRCEARTGQAPHPRPCRRPWLAAAALSLIAAALPAADSYTFTTLAGSAGQAGSADGPGTGARFNRPQGIAVDPAGNVYVADTDNHTIRRITPDGVVTTLAGRAGVSGTDDGTGVTARFEYPAALVAAADGTLFVADTGNSCIRRVSPLGNTTTWAGRCGTGGWEDGSRTTARFCIPEGIALGPDGTLYVADWYFDWRSDDSGGRLRRITPDGFVSTLAGSWKQSGNTDGTGTAARFRIPTGTAITPAGDVFVVDDAAIRRITPTGVVTTFAGAAGQLGTTDGTGTGARFHGPWGLAADASGVLFVVDCNVSTIRRIDRDAAVTTLAGAAGQSGSTDGPAAVARFDAPFGIAVDAAGNLYIADTHNHTIRKGTRAAEAAAIRTYSQGSMRFLEQTAGGHTVRLGIDTHWGGTITELSRDGTNYVNANDPGRMVQTSLWDGNDTYGPTWGYNPYQAGDTAFHPSPVVAQSVSADTIYTKTWPLQWSPWYAGGTGGPLASDAYIEQWITAVPAHPNGFRVHLKVTHFGTDAHALATQEFPVVYVNRGWDDFVYYGGPAPWTNGPLSHHTMPYNPDRSPQLHTPENWGAYVDAGGSGLTVYLPGSYPWMYGFNAAGPSPAGTNHCVGTTPACWEPGTVLESDFYLFAGPVDAARSAIYDLHPAQPPDGSFPPLGYIGLPAADATVSGLVAVDGWCTGLAPITDVGLFVDGVRVATATYGTSRPDVAAYFPTMSAQTGFAGTVDSTRLSDGSHAITARATDAAGRTSTFATRRVTVANAATGAPVFRFVLGSPSAVAGADAWFTATGYSIESIRWQRRAAGQAGWVDLVDDGTYGGAATSNLRITGVTAAMDGDAFRCVATNTHGTTTTAALVLRVAGAAPRFHALATRAAVGAGTDVLIPGLAITGSAPKKILIRALGPWLHDRGVANFLADPTINLLTLTGEPVAACDDWDCRNPEFRAAFAQVGLTDLPDGSKDAVLVATLPPGLYTPVIAGKNGGIGVALVEFYDLDPGTGALAAISTRAMVGTGADVLIPGVVIAGDAPKRVLVRVAGPALVTRGVGNALRDPVFELKDAGGTTLLSNDNWDNTDAALIAATTAVGAPQFDSGSKDAALLTDLPPGIYTIVIRGVNDTTGVALVELFGVPSSPPQR